MYVYNKRQLQNMINKTMSKIFKIEYDDPVISVYDPISYDHYVNDIKKYTFRMDTKNKLFIVTLNDVSEKCKKEYIKKQINSLKERIGYIPDYKEIIDFEKNDKFYKDGLLSGYYFIAPLYNHYKINKSTGNFYHKKHLCKDEDILNDIYTIWNALFLKYINDKGYKI